MTSFAKKEILILSSESVMAAEAEYWAHAEYHYYSICLQCEWMKIEILRANSNSSIPWRVASTSHITSPNISSAWVRPDSWSDQWPGQRLDLLTISVSFGWWTQRAQHHRIIQTPHRFECRSRPGETGNEVSSRRIYAWGNKEWEGGGGQSPADNLRSERHEHFPVAPGNSQCQRAPTMGHTLLLKGPFADELPSQNL